MPLSNEVLLQKTLRLLLNLSFDAEVREQMLQCRMVPRIEKLLHEPQFSTARGLSRLPLPRAARPRLATLGISLPYPLSPSPLGSYPAPLRYRLPVLPVRQLALALLYHLSVDDAAKFQMSYGDSNVVPFLFDRLMQEEDLHAAPELIALVVNLALERRAAEQLVTPPQRLAALLSAAAQRKEPLFLKVVRNAAQALAEGPPAAQELLARFHPHVPSLLSLAREAQGDAEMLVELLGTLVTLCEADPPAVVPAALSADAVRLLAAHLAPGAVDDDVMLEAVMLLGALACDEAADDMVAAGVPGRLYALMSAQKDDDEFVLQTCWTFYRLLLVPATRSALLRGTQARARAAASSGGPPCPAPRRALRASPTSLCLHEQQKRRPLRSPAQPFTPLSLPAPQVVIYLVDLLQDEHAEIARVAGLALDAVTDHDEEWASRIRGLKFEAHNAEWIEAVESSQSPGPGGGVEGAEDDDEFAEGRYHGGGCGGTHRAPKGYPRPAIGARSLR